MIIGPIVGLGVFLALVLIYSVAFGLVVLIGTAIDLAMQGVRMRRIARDQCGWCGAPIGEPHRKRCSNHWAHADLGKAPFFRAYRCEEDEA